MLEPLRFTAIAGTLFVMSYFGAAWVMVGKPVPPLQWDSPVEIVESPPIITTGSIAKPPAAPAALPRGDGHPQRDTLRLDALQASTAYAQSPCDEAAKTAMIRTVSAYATAWAEMMGCGPDGCDYKRINATAAVFSTPLDLQLRDAVVAAFDRRSISLDDFPSTLRINVAMLARGRGTSATACPQPGAGVIH